MFLFSKGAQRGPKAPRKPSFGEHKVLSSSLSACVGTITHGLPSFVQLRYPVLGAAGGLGVYLYLYSPLNAGFGWPAMRIPVLLRSVFCRHMAWSTAPKSPLLHFSTCAPV